MFKLLIADDEKVIRESLAKCIDWERNGIKVVGCCANGLEALDCIIDESPDIILTDIKMPGLSGLELISKIQDIDREIEFIILSGYQEFDFAKQAIELGVLRYLLKPVSEEQVTDAVLDAVKGCQRQRSLKAAMDERNRLQLQLKQYHRQQLHIALLTGNLPEEALYTNLEQFYSQESRYFNIAVTVQDLDEACQLVRTISPRLLSKGLDLVTDCLYVKDTLLAILHGNPENAEKLFEQILAMYSTMDVQSYAGPSLSSCVQRIYKDISLCSRIYIIGETGNAYELNRAKLTPEIMQMLPDQLLSLSEDGTKGKMEGHDDMDLVQMVKNYVWSNLDDPSLSLKQIASQYAHVNADYLSRLFVQKTGEKFSHYLNRKRVEKAKQLLLKDSGKIYRIAEQVGLGHNPSYFGQIFKKYLGVTPSAFIEAMKVKQTD